MSMQLRMFMPYKKIALPFVVSELLPFEQFFSHYPYARYN